MRISIAGLLSSLAAALIAAPGPQAALAADVAATRAGGDPSETASLFSRPFHIIAHRGASAYAPENTLPAFQRALELGAFEVELDVRLTRDGDLVIFHDEQLDAKTALSGPVRDHDLATLRETDIGAWFDATHPDALQTFVGTTLVSLAELFAAFGDRLYYHVEIKDADEGVPPLVLRRLREFGLETHATMTSFRFAQLGRMKRLAPGLPLSLLVEPDRVLRAAARAGGQGDVDLLTLQQRVIDRAAQAGFQEVGIRASDLGPEIVRYGRKRGLSVRAWKVRNDEDMDRAIRLGTNGMTTDFPDRLIRRLVELGAGR